MTIKNVIIPILFVLAMGAASQSHNPNTVQDTCSFLLLFTNWKVYVLLGSILACVWFFIKVSYPAIHAAEKRRAEKERKPKFDHRDFMEEERIVGVEIGHKRVLNAFLVDQRIQSEINLKELQHGKRVH